MNSLSKYILEKLIIDKDTKIEQDNLFNIVKKFFADVILSKKDIREINDTIDSYFDENNAKHKHVRYELYTVKDCNAILSKYDKDYFTGIYDANNFISLMNIWNVNKNDSIKEEWPHDITRDENNLEITFDSEKRAMHIYYSPGKTHQEFIEILVIMTIR